MINPGDLEGFAMRTLGLLVVVGSCLFQAQLKAGEKDMTEQQRIQGTWQLVSGERHGKAFSEETLKSVTLVFAEDVLTTKNKDRGNEAKFRLHPETTPKGIDLIMDGSVGEGIYSLDGNELTILHGEVGDPRPATFDAKAFPTSSLLVLRRNQ